MDHSTLMQLIRPQAFPHPAGDIVLRETHISWVVLAGEYAYKIKKPVNFGFLDFSTLDLRRHYCEQELALNRRFAPALYLAVVEITSDQEGPRFEGDGPTVEYAVKMRRFDESLLLDNLASQGELDRSLVRDLARELAFQHKQARVCHPDPESDEPGSPAALWAALLQNFRQVRDYQLVPDIREQLSALEQWTRQQYSSALPLMRERVARGYVIDGHGDAHLGNIALIDSQVCLFDCIEFNPALRIMDSISEIAFLGMDLQARGHPGEAHCLLCDYLEYRGDYRGLALLQLYRSYFAMVRAKVALLREPANRADIEASEAYGEFRRYLTLAGEHSLPGTPFLAITHGVSGTGKSTVADKLAAAGAAVRIRSDVERKRLFGLAPEQRSDPADEKQLYGSDMSRKTFDRLEQLATEALEAGFSVIVDATFLHRYSRDRFRLLAGQLGLPFVIIDCTASPDELRQRLLTREKEAQDASEAGVRVMESQQEVDQPPAGDELLHRMEAHSDQDASTLWRQLQSVCNRQGGRAGEKSLSRR